MTATTSRGVVATTALAASALLLTGCVPNAGSDASAQSIAVTASDTDCVVETAEATSGTITFTVKNEGTKVNEFYVLGSNQLTIVGEVENIAPERAATSPCRWDPATTTRAANPG